MFASMHGADPLPERAVPDGHPGGVQRPAVRPSSPVPYVDVDHVGGVGKAVRHLLDAGRQRIATIAGPQDMVAGIDRLTGYRDQLPGCRPAARSWRSATSPGSRARVAMRQLLDDDPAWTRCSSPPT